MSETMGLATSQHPFDSNKIGTIGKAVEGFDLIISDAGEVLIKGPAVFGEYYKNPEATAEAFTEEGYFRTGDKALMDADGYLRITGRVKDIFKSGKGLRYGQWFTSCHGCCCAVTRSSARDAARRNC